jgi:hypothetical protein
MVTARPMPRPKRSPSEEDHARAQEQVAADGRRVPGRLRDRNSSAAPRPPISILCWRRSVSYFTSEGSFFRPPFDDAIGRREPGVRRDRNFSSP